MISVTLQFSDVAAAAQALMRIATPEQFATTVSALPGGLPTEPTSGPLTVGQTVIAHADRPDVGAPVAAPLPPADPYLAGITAKLDPAAAAFGGAVAQAAPLVPVAPLTPPPAAPSMPTAATAPTAAPAAERDSTGLPWDARIHASTKTKVASGAWTAKRNVDAALKAQVEADLRGVAAPAPAAAAPAAPPVAPPAAPAAGPAPTFAVYMAQVGEFFNNRPLDAMNAMTAALAPHGLQHVGQLAGRSDLIPAIDAEFRRLLG